VSASGGEPAGPHLLLRRFGGDAVAALLALGLITLLPTVAARHARPALLDVGPNDWGYLAGFRSDWERQGDWQFRWTTKKARVELPLHIGGKGARLRLRVSRHLTEPARVILSSEGRIAGSFEIWADGQALYRVIEVPLPELSGRRTFELGIEAQSASPRPLGIAIDWLEVDRGEDAWFALTGATLWRLLLLALVALLAPRLAGAPRSWAFLHAASLVATVSWATWRDIVATERVLRDGVLAYAAVGVGLTLLLAFGRLQQILRLPSRRWAGALCLLSLVALGLRLALLLHPHYFYPDLLIHGIFARILARQGLATFMRDLVANQFRYSLGLQMQGQHWYAFPYPPTFYLLTWPLTRLLGYRPEVAVIIVAAMVNSLQVPLVYALGRRLGCGARCAMASAAAVPLLPIFLRRLSLALFPALLGQTFEALVLLFLASRYRRLGRLLPVVVLSALIAAALLAYTQSLLSLGIVLPLFLAFELVSDPSGPGRRRQLGLTLSGLLGGALAFGVFYHHSVPVFRAMYRGEPVPEERIVLDIFEHRAATQAPVAEPPNDPYAGPGIHPTRGVLKAASHLLDFYGPFAPAVVLGWGLLVAGSAGASRRLLLAWVLAFLVLNLASAGLPSPNLFRHAKDMLLAAVPACLALGAPGDWLYRKARPLGWLFGLAYLAYAGWNALGCFAERMTILH